MTQGVNASVLAHGFQKSIPSSADISLVAAVNNWVIGHSVEKKKKCIHARYGNTT